MSENTFLKSKSTLARNIIIISCALLLVGALLLVYFIWVKPASEKNKGPKTLLDGEYYDASTDTLLIFNYHDRNEIKTIELKNNNDHYFLDAFVEEGFSRFETKDQTIFLQNLSLENIIKDKGHTLERGNDNASYVILRNVSKENLSNYGLEDEKVSKISFLSEDGHTYSFYLGDYRDISDGYAYYLYLEGPENGTYTIYTIYAITSSTTFVIRGSEDTELDFVSVSSLVVGAGNVNVISPSSGQYRLNEKATLEDLKLYGLDSESDPSYVEVTLQNGETYKYYIGNQLTSKGGYYIMAEGRKNIIDGVEYDVVYAFNSTSAEAMLAGSESIVTTLVVDYIGNEVGNVTDFRLYRREKEDDEDYTLIMSAGIIDEKTKTATNTSYLLLYPSAYILDESKYYSSILSNLAYIYGIKTYAYGERVYDSEIYEKYFLDCDKERLENGTDKNYAKIMYSLEERDENGNAPLDSYTTIYFSEKQTDETGVSFYYVYSPERQLISAVDEETYKFIEFKLADFTNGRLYFNYINSTAYFELISKRYNTNVRYLVTGNEKTLTAIATETKDDGNVLKRVDYKTQTEIDAVFKLQYERRLIGTYIDIKYVGDFEYFRSLYYVLITRPIYADIDISQYLASEESDIQVNIMSIKKDQSISYYKYKADGSREVDANGNNIQVRYLGGNIICNNIVVNTTISGEEVTQKYDLAYYDESAKRFFLKVNDSIDGYDKPANYSYDSENNLVITRYLPANTTGEYTAILYKYEIKDIYTLVKDSDGNETKRMNQTYKMMTPTVVETTYRIEADGSRTVIKEVVNEGQQSVLVRTQSIEKLFETSGYLLDGKEFNRDSIN